MKVYPARFVGEIDYGDCHGPSAPEHRVGDVRRVARFVSDSDDWAHGPYIAIDCACGARYLAALAPFAFSNGASWHLTSENPVHMDPSLITNVGSEPKCHLFVHGGQLQMLDDTTKPLKELER